MQLDDGIFTYRTSVLIFEPRSTGHYMHYVRRITRVMNDYGLTVALLTTKEAELSREFAVTMGGLNFELIAEMDRVGDVSVVHRQLQFLRWLTSVTQRERPAHVLVPYGNHLDKALALCGFAATGSDISLLVMRDRFHLTAMGANGPAPSKWSKVEEWTHRRILKNRKVRTLFTIDPLLGPYSRQMAYRGTDKIVYVPDPVAPFKPFARDAAREAFGIPLDRRVLLLYGALNDERKGAAEAIEGMALLDDPQTHLFAVGRQSESIQAMFRSDAAQGLRSQGRLTEIDRYVDADDEARAFAAADAVWVGYRGHYGQSGVLFQAAAAGHPTIATSEGLIGYEAKMMPNGVILTSHTVGDVAAAMRRVLHPLPEERERWRVNAAAIAREHDDTTFGRSILSGLGFLDEASRS